MDDDAEFREVLAHALRRQGYTVLTSPNGFPALVRCRLMYPDVFLLDEDWPYPTAEDMIARLRKISPVPILLMTAAPQSVAEDLLRYPDVAEVLPKPFRMRKLLDQLEGTTAASRRP